MKTNYKILNDLSVEELQSIINDLQHGVRYNDIKAKYNLAPNAVTANTLHDCEKLLSEKQPVEKEKKCTGIYGIKNTTPEEHAELIAIGVKVDKNGYYVW